VSDPEDGAPSPASGPDRALRRRVVAQFSGAGERAAVWRGFERFLPTAEYLNLGYSPRLVPTVVGDSQARLAAHLAEGLRVRVPEPGGTRLLDVGCGRGGPARQFAARGFDVVGVDLVPHNVALALANADGDSSPPAFLVGDATALPLADDAVGAATAVDALVYLPEKRAAFREVARALAPGGWLAVADLLAAEETGPEADAALSAFADAWDMAPLVDGGTYREHLRAAGLTVEAVEDVSANSTARFRKWSRAFLALADGPTGGVVRRLLQRWDVDPDAAIAQVRAANRALPHLRHEVVYARR
jgi:MPBQ/MSBQ methyltransferase